MTVPSTLSERIAQARRELAVREHRDITQLDMARAVGVSGASISQWESGAKVPREDVLAKLAAYLGVTPAYLRYGVRETKQPADEGGLTITPGPMLTPAQIARAVEKSAAKKAAKKDADRAAAKSARPTRRPGNGGRSA